MIEDPRKKIDNLLAQIEKGKIPPEKAWSNIHQLKAEYVEVLGKLHPDKNMEQSWHKYVGHKFQTIIYSIIKGYLRKLMSQNSDFGNLKVLKEGSKKE